MKVYLVQHAEALPAELNADRPLSPKGEGQFEKLVRFLATHTFPLSAILHSPQLRAKQTAEILRSHLEPGLKLEEHAHLNPNDPIEPLLKRIEDGVMIVSHLPFLQKLSGHLVSHDQEATVVSLAQGKVVCFEKLGERFALNWAIGTNFVS